VTGQATAGWAAGQRPRKLDGFILLLQISLIAYCLILTKSRSAWAGALMGLGILSIVRSRTSAAVRVFRWGMTGALVVAAAVGAAAFFGALDKEVILESPRSLQFRLFYWTGTLKMLREHPWAGAGPGNFRQLYLQHKADQSSEEIRDPHNFVLEAWSAGGVVGLVGLLLFAGGILRAMNAKQLPGIGLGQFSQVAQKSWVVVPSGLLLGFCLHAGWEWLNGHEFSLDQVPKLLLLAGIVLVAIRSDRGLRPVDSTSGLAAATAMMVHLLAAGGFEMPVVMLFLLACSAIGISGAKSSTIPEPSRFGRPWRWMSVPAAGMSLGMAVVVLQYGLIPVSTSERHIQAADHALQQQRNPRVAVDGYRRAAESDPLGTSARQRLADLETYRLADIEAAEKQEIQDPESADNLRSAVANGQSRVEQMLPEALSACDLLISADRRSSIALRTRAVCLAIGGRVLKNPEMLSEAVRMQKQVVHLYPSSIEDWVELVTLCETPLAGCGSDLSRQAAQRALDLDQINREWGHQDRYLAEEQLELLRGVVEQ
jgi:hypothetical protein